MRRPEPPADNRIVHVRHDYRTGMVTLIAADGSATVEPFLMPTERINGKWT